MNQGIHAAETESPTPVPVRRQITASPHKGNSHSSLRSRLGTIREMLSTIDSATLAGQRYTMGKVVAFFEELVANGDAEVGEGSRFMLARLLRQLGHEGARSFPDAARFNQHAKDVLRLLGAV